MNIFEQFKSVLGISAAGDAAAAPANDTYDAAARSPDNVLPPNPFAPGSSPTQGSSRGAHIDLTSSPRQLPSYDRKPKRRPDTTLARPPSRYQKSVEERRLIGDYGTPADSVKVPDPISYFTSSQPSSRPAMVKPGAVGAFKPVDTLHGNRSAPVQKKGRTYSKTFAKVPPTIGYQSGHGEEQYRQMQQAKYSTNLARDVTAHQEQTYFPGASSPTKRRKTDPRSPPHSILETDPVMDLTGDDEEVQETHSRRFTGTPKVRASRASPSRRSIERPATQEGTRHNPVFFGSASQAVNALAKKGKARQRTPGSQRKSSHGGSMSGSGTPNSQHTPTIHILEDDAAVATKPSSIFDDFQQGEPDRGPQVRTVQKKGPITSRHFPDARINENTDDAGRQPANRQAKGLKDNPRTFMPADKGVAEIDPIRDSDDELGMSPPPRKTKSTKRQVSPSKSAHVANKGAKRGSKTQNTTLTWPLIYARGHGFETRSSVTSEGNQPLIQLERDNEDGSWRIVEYEKLGLPGVLQGRITPKDVIKVFTDNVGRVRLEGPRGGDGVISIFDLDFQIGRDLRDFRDKYAVNWTPLQKVYSKDPSDMRRLFSAPLLPKNDKIGTSALVHDSIEVEDDQLLSQHFVSRTPKLDYIRGTNGKTNGSPGIFASTRSPTRPPRATRSKATVYDLEESHKEPTIVKYSEVEGLGPRWLSPLTYALGRQRAVVNFDDLSRLDDDEMLNDSLIDFYMIYLFDKYKIPEKKIYFFNTYFYTKLTEKTGRNKSIDYEAVKRWTSKIDDIFTYDYIVVPIHEATHWYLALICNVGNIARKLVDEESGENAADHPTVDDANLVDPAESRSEELPAEQQLQEAPNDSTVVEQTTQQQGGEDAILFDEESMISTVDREDTGLHAGRDDLLHDTSLPQSPRQTEQAVLAVDAAPHEDTVSLTVLSNLKSSQLKPKQSKRKPPVIKRDPSQPVIIVLDSLAGTHSNAVRALKDWLAAEGMERRAIEAVIKEKGVYPKGDQIPTQTNFSDCGVYVLGYVEKFFQDPDEFTRKLLTGDMTAEDDWPNMKVGEMRNGLRNILFKLADKDQLTVEKKRKGKKAATATKKPPSPSKPQPATSAPQVAESNQTETSRPADAKDEPEKPTTIEPSTSLPKAQQADEPSRPRLGSPFALQPRHEASVTHAESPECTIGNVSDSPPVSTSPSKHAITSPQKQTPGRKTHPEIRIPVKTPNSHQSPVNGRSAEPSATRTNGVHRMGLDGSVSPTKRSRQVADNGDDQRNPASVKRAKSASTEKERRSLHGSPAKQAQRDGSSDNPIEIEDSQDTRPKANAVYSPHDFRTGSPTKRKRPSRSPRTMQTLHHAPSVEEIPRPALQDVTRKHRQPEEQEIGSQLEAMLDEQDEVLSLERRDSVPDLMDLDDQGADPMDTSADVVVRETPEKDRASPGWTASQPLPH